VRAPLVPPVDIKRSLLGSRSREREREREALWDCAKLRGFNADLGEYKKTIEQQLEQADKKIAKQLHTIQKLNHNKDWRDEEIFNLEEAGRAVVNMVQPLRLGYHDSRSVLAWLKNVPGWLRDSWRKKSSRG